jgi:organic radical activating enzyme
MSQIIKIVSSNKKLFHINYQLTRNCVYSCKYCPSEYQTGLHPNIDIPAFTKFLKTFDRTVLLNLTGGEVTTHPQLAELMIAARESGAKIKIDTNGVRTPRWYAEHADLADVWCMCFHPSQHKFDIERVKVLTDRALVIVYVMMDPKHWDLAFSWYEQLKSIENIKLIMIRPVDNWAGANYVQEWTDEQIQLVSEPPRWQFTDERRAVLEASHWWLKDTDTFIHWDNGEVSVLDPDLMMKNGTNSFFNWTCHAGEETAWIDPSGMVSWANCGIAQLGHYSTLDHSEFNKSYRCTILKCNCGSDIRGSKERV